MAHDSRERREPDLEEHSCAYNLDSKQAGGRSPGGSHGSSFSEDSHSFSDMAFSRHTAFPPDLLSQRLFPVTVVTSSGSGQQNL